MQKYFYFTKVSPTMTIEEDFCKISLHKLNCCWIEEESGEERPTQKKFFGSNLKAKRVGEKIKKHTQNKTGVFQLF